MALVYVTQTPGNNALTAARMMAAARRADAKQSRVAAIKAQCADTLRVWLREGVKAVAIEVEYFDGARFWRTLSPADAVAELEFIYLNPDFVGLSDLEAL